MEWDNVNSGILKDVQAYFYIAFCSQTTNFKVETKDSLDLNRFTPCMQA